MNLFWTWDTPEFIAQKFNDIVFAKHLGGVMGWSFGEDTFDNSHILAIQAGVEALTVGECNDLSFEAASSIMS